MKNKTTLSKAKLTHARKKIRVNKENINMFVTPEWNRPINPTNRNKIIRDLINGVGLHATLAVNRINNTYRIVDGNHRMSAIKTYLETNNYLDIDCNIYTDLTIQEEKEIWLIYETKKTHNKYDIFKLFVDEIPIVSLLLKNNFVIYFSNNSGEGRYPLLWFLETYINRDKQFGSNSIMNTIEESKKLNIGDGYNIIWLAKDFSEVFGSPYGNKNKYYSTTAIYIIGRIYFYCLENKLLSRNQIKKQLSNIKNDSDLYNTMKRTGIGHCKIEYKRYIDVFNKRLRTTAIPYFLENDK